MSNPSSFPCSNPPMNFSFPPTPLTENQTPNSSNISALCFSGNLIVGKNDGTIMECDSISQKALWTLRLNNHNGLSLSTHTITLIDSKYLMITDNLLHVYIIDRHKGCFDPVNFSLNITPINDREKYAKLPFEFQQKLSYEEFKNLCHRIFQEKSHQFVLRSSDKYQIKHSTNNFMQIGKINNDIVSFQLVKMPTGNILSFDIHDSKVALGCTDHNIYIANPDKEKSMIRHTLLGHTGDVVFLKWVSKDLLLSISKDNTMRIWDTKYYQCLHVWKYENLIQKAAYYNRILMTVYDNDSVKMTPIPQTKEEYLQAFVSNVCTWNNIDQPSLDSNKTDESLKQNWKAQKIREYYQCKDPKVIASGFTGGICQGMVCKPSAHLNDKGEVDFYKNEDLVNERIEYFRTYDSLVKTKTRKQTPEMRIPLSTREKEGISDVKKFIVDLNMYCDPTLVLQYLLDQAYGHAVQLSDFKQADKWFTAWLDTWKTEILEDLLKQKHTIKYIRSMTLDLLDIKRNSSNSNDLEMQIGLSITMDANKGALSASQAHVFSIKILKDKHLVIEEPNYGIWQFNKKQ